MGILHPLSAPLISASDSHLVGSLDSFGRVTDRHQTSPRQLQRAPRWQPRHKHAYSMQPAHGRPISSSYVSQKKQRDRAFVPLRPSRRHARRVAGCLADRSETRPPSIIGKPIGPLTAPLRGSRVATSSRRSPVHSHWDASKAAARIELPSTGPFPRWMRPSSSGSLHRPLASCKLRVAECARCAADAEDLAFLQHGLTLRICVSIPKTTRNSSRLSKPFRQLVCSALRVPSEPDDHLACPRGSLKSLTPRPVVSFLQPRSLPTRTVTRRAGVPA